MEVCRSCRRHLNDSRILPQHDRVIEILLQEPPTILFFALADRRRADYRNNGSPDPVVHTDKRYHLHFVKSSTVLTPTLTTIPSRRQYTRTWRETEESNPGLNNSVYPVLQNRKKHPHGRCQLTRDRIRLSEELSSCRGTHVTDVPCCRSVAA